MFLLNYFCKSLKQNEKEQKINKEYNIYDIETKILGSNNYTYINKFYNFKANIENDSILNISNKELSEAIKFIPLTKNRNSHTVTTLISGFLSQKRRTVFLEKFF